MAKMIYYTFYNTDNNFSELSDDRVIKTNFKITWDQHMMLGFEDDVDEKMLGYIVIKYGEMMRDPINLDRTPIPGVDYFPKRKSKI
jgi:hypothetical protein